MANSSLGLALPSHPKCMAVSVQPTAMPCPGSTSRSASCCRCKAASARSRCCRHSHCRALLTHADIPVAAVVLKAVCPQGQRHQADMARVHRLQAEAAVVAVEVGILDQVLDGLHDLQGGPAPRGGAPIGTFERSRSWRRLQCPGAASRQS